jgi:hypothetical protein
MAEERRAERAGNKADGVARTAIFATNNPAGAPHCGHAVMKPRWAVVFAHSIATKVAPPHSPPTPIPWMKRMPVRMHRTGFWPKSRLSPSRFSP